MGTVHLGSGSIQPDKVDGKVRLYSMKFCPFAHRVRLALTYKQIPHEIVNINLKNKPDWFLQINKEGRVPALVDLDGKVIVDSITILNHLEEKYPDPTLSNKETITRDLELIDYYDKIVKAFSDCIHKKDTRPLLEIVTEISGYMGEYEEELKKRNTKFFAGDKPGMLDIIMWPFIERAKSLSIICHEPLGFEKEKFPLIMKWFSEMKNQDFVQQNAGSPEDFAKIVEASNTGTVDYDNF